MSVADSVLGELRIVRKSFASFNGVREGHTANRNRVQEGIELQEAVNRALAALSRAPLPDTIRDMLDDVRALGPDYTRFKKAMPDGTVLTQQAIAALIDVEAAEIARAFTISKQKLVTYLASLWETSWSSIAIPADNTELIDCLQNTHRRVVTQVNDSRVLDYELKNRNKNKAQSDLDQATKNVGLIVANIKMKKYFTYSVIFASLALSKPFDDL